MVIMAAIMASVLPQVTHSSVSGSTALPRVLDIFPASASLRFWAPNVTEY